MHSHLLFPRTRLISSSYHDRERAWYEGTLAPHDSCELTTALLDRSPQPQCMNWPWWHWTHRKVVSAKFQMLEEWLPRDVWHCRFGGCSSYWCKLPCSVDRLDTRRWAQRETGSGTCWLCTRAHGHHFFAEEPGAVINKKWCHLKWCRRVPCCM